MPNYVMISAQEFCDLTGLTMARFKRYRKLLHAAPKEPFPAEVYEYHTTVIFDVEELCEWFIDLYEDMVPSEESRLGEAARTLQHRLKVEDLNTVDDLATAVQRAKVLGFVGYSNRERVTLQKQLDKAYKDYLKLPKEILASKKVLTESQRLLKRLRVNPGVDCG
ncbi:hypothetical protein ADL22_12710 [Streptomyces sp. NRRL F-4489]|uniref:hypothetical protein n=1 Tax=Streptomyces sp. NRRL F-4489 TaxID=1609095 RepID=UPI0007489479|nr:hypothetical protein [Streptomyces sp. NRRL F-4489]KUL44798.1 hypothetical protein ADL22_12710 [Streptomyces sp. NRRL F-4489]